MCVFGCRRTNFQGLLNCLLDKCKFMHVAICFENAIFSNLIHPGIVFKYCILQTFHNLSTFVAFEIRFKPYQPESWLEKLSKTCKIVEKIWLWFKTAKLDHIMDEFSSQAPLDTGLNYSQGAF